jgi:hypothetical protein
LSVCADATEEPSAKIAARRKIADFMEQPFMQRSRTATA